MKKDERKLITVTKKGIVTVPKNVRMSIGEIADLFSIYYQTAKRHIRSVEKSGIVTGDYSMSCVSDGWKIYPEYYGLEMIIAVAFRVRSSQAEIFRKWILTKAGTNDSKIQIYISCTDISLN